ncbi:hypothetical protein [Amycolatopsis vastitatis]|uniref:hypothetical protein n=1 Tax=Amycolatopsis vastitatis TaxID=1905142 RepID=UPI001178498F|nr:hypothetical protein [Amycolatopsis vastitatis]
MTEWFPLLPRTRPHCRALDHRVEEIRQLTRAAAGKPAEDRIATAAEAHNKAALVLSDCGLHDAAHQLCWQQFDLFHANWPLPVRSAKLALQPVVNLGRLLVRAGHFDRAYEIFVNVFDAVRNQTTTTVDGRKIDFSPFVVRPEHHKEVVRFLWTVLLADGTRALTRAGRWHDALQHVQNQKGIARRMLDGRQVAILERYFADDYDAALHLLDHSETPDAWDRAVAGFLRALCLRSIAPADRAMPTAEVEKFLHPAPTPGHPVFRIRLGLCILDLTADVDAPRLAAQLVREALTSGDAYLARDVLTHDRCRSDTTEDNLTTLTATVHAAGLGRGALPNRLRDALTAAVRASEALLTTW